MNQLVGLCLAVNIIYAQAVVARDSWFGIDKIKHFFMSAFIESVSFSALQAMGAKRRAALAGGIGTAAALGIGRELHDRRTRGKWFSYRDLGWDALGTAAGAVMLSHTIK